MMKKIEVVAFLLCSILVSGLAVAEEVGEVLEITAQDRIITLRSQHAFPFNKRKPITTATKVRDVFGKPSRITQFSLYDERSNSDEEREVWYYEKDGQTEVYVFSSMWRGMPAGLLDRYIVSGKGMVITSVRE